MCSHLCLVCEVLSMALGMVRSEHTHPLLDPSSAAPSGVDTTGALAGALPAPQHKKASNHHANLPLEMYSFTL